MTLFTVVAADKVESLRQMMRYTNLLLHVGAALTATGLKDNA